MNNQDTSFPPAAFGADVGDPWRYSTIKQGKAYGNEYSSQISHGASSSQDVDRSEDSAVLDTKAWFWNLDTIRIGFAPEKEGLFLFKHTNYVIESKNHNCKVTRRYSDFVYLQSILEKRYPFRMLPLLPPKRLGAADEIFLGRRLRGLTRFMNAVVHHPVLKEDSLVTVFLTEPMEFTSWRNFSTVSVEDEFSKLLPEAETMSKQIPADFILQVESIKRRLPGSIDYYRGMVHTMDRIQKRTQANAADYSRFGLAVNTLGHSCHKEGCYSCGQLHEGNIKIGTHIYETSGIMKEHSKAIQYGIIEELKRHRDMLVSMGELLRRCDQRNDQLIETLHRKIESTESLLASTTANQEVAPPDVDPGQFEATIERLNASLGADRRELFCKEQRTLLMQHTLWMETVYYHKNQAHVAAMFDAFVQEQIQTSQRQLDTWSSLSPIVHNLPMETNSFN
ncbi:Sorting nexin mvp1 [Podila humilis]|nr:Sorting nexin mvp1 [Podila humilis]